MLKNIIDEFVLPSYAQLVLDNQALGSTCINVENTPTKGLPSIATYFLSVILAKPNDGN